MAPSKADLEAGPDVPIALKAEQPKKQFSGWKTSWWRRFLFFDVEPLVGHGYKTRLEPQDMFPEPTLKTQHLIGTFEPAFQREHARTDGKPDLKRVILAGNVGMLLWTGLLYLISQACSLAGPLLLQRIVKGLNCLGAQRKMIAKLPPGAPIPDLGCEDKATLYYYCIGLFLAPAVQSICENHQTYLLYLMGTRMRNSLMAAIYRKCLRLSNSALQAESTGKVVTLMSNDAQKLQDATMAIHAMWGSPCYIVAILVLLWYQVGWAMFVGLGIMLTIVPLTGMLAGKLGGLRREIMQWTDKRVGYMNEVISGMQMIKFYAWEVPFTDAVQGARAQEARILRITAFWQGVFGMVLFSGPIAVAVFCFGSYTLAGNELDNAQAYTALALFSLLRFPMSFLPMLITMVVNALIALRRIGGFLERPEAGMPEPVDSVPQGSVRVTDGDFTWEEGAEKPTVSGLTFEAKPGSLTMVVGGVGSGKSSVLSALIGHISKKTGEVAVNGSVAYVAQSAWIMNDTLQENVLMGGELRPDAYKAALTAAQLGPDLEILPNGDLTEIGDRGVTLSGGQKQRVSIARAVYAGADIYLLDDPLSAVDSHVGRALFEECIRGPLRGKTVILVTNALQWLPHADNVLLMDGGKVIGQGTYQQLVEQGLNIEELAHLHDKDPEDDEGAEVDQATPGTEVPHAGEGGKRKSVDHKKGARASMDRRVGEGKVSLVRANTVGGNTANRNLTGVEEREAGNISLDVLRRYFAAGGSWFAFLTLLVLYGLEQASRVYTDKWVGIWFGNEHPELGLGGYLGIYAGMGVFYGFVTFLRSLRFLFICVNATVNLHNALLHHLLRLPKSFFDTNPAGRILNRFSRDVDIMDATLPGSLIQFVGCVTTYISILVVISIATKWFAIALGPLTIVYFFIQRFYIPTARELQRIESVSRSPIYSKFGEALAGVCTIRAYRCEAHFTAVSDELMERNAAAFVTQKLAAAWLACRLDILGLVVLTGCGALVIAGNVDPGMAGLALVYALDLTRFLKHGTNMASKSEADFNSVERIVQYLKPETEAEPESAPEVKAALDKAEWPKEGALSVEKLAMRYRPNMPLVLRGVSFHAAPGEKVGLVGRTGSGKSSIFLALFRMVEAESGRVVIDGVDIATLGLRDLRSKMSIIPQDPFMFSGSVRKNLDPFSAHADTALWEVLDKVGLHAAISALDDKLEAKVVDGGANFSLGQRQLFCMARAMLRQSKILMLDEATASVDLDTDNAIQVAIREAFAATTTLIIAHRLNTIMDVDRVVVMGDGQVLEADHPDSLLQNHKGSFSAMVDQTGKSSARYLRGLASSARAGESFRVKSMMRTGLSFLAGRQGASDAASPSGSFTAPSAASAASKGSGPGSPVKASDLEISLTPEDSVTGAPPAFKHAQDSLTLAHKRLGHAKSRSRLAGPVVQEEGEEGEEGDEGAGPSDEGSSGSGSSKEVPKK
eukprot:CAMPEP_0202857580 /NCGR_PEP_ID=MMETSP1391-20130828/470_1 /ASSEMBLY_ACC=CAM_ASM_000867 /TAXON_ID=1034604 /ORGANISM="Chlamydomonas leiostraca, Strain SAG 11-49" /LENGTH=1463 /DNA_ID=CAMNT_0049536397 /DNA_START=117 /DNA_END=4508 /DNA_ORIENTATION=-